MPRHERLYLPDGTLTIMAGDGSKMLYNVYRGQLALGSELLAGMFSLPNPVIPAIGVTENARAWFNKAREQGLGGTSDDTAIVFPPQFSAAEIEIFFEFMYLQGWSRDNPDVATSCAILKLSHYLIVPQGIAYARRYLDNNPEFTPVNRMSLAFPYHFADWIGSAFDELMGISINNLSEDEEKVLGPLAYRALARAQAKVLDARLRLALKAPDVNHCNYCSNIPYCREEWEKMWTSVNGVLGALIKEDLPGSVIMDKLRTYSRGGMTYECHRRTCEGLQDTEDKVSILREEEGLIDEAVAALLKATGVPLSL
ncbi:hypothetical protein C8R46DRAFT_1227235 [Mycena filopes]|nr:hypothetical protein C8R46DRAFT_1227235 [Mycena filopes]